MLSQGNAETTNVPGQRRRIGGCQVQAVAIVPPPQKKWPTEPSCRTPVVHGAELGTTYLMALFNRRMKTRIVCIPRSFANFIVDHTLLGHSLVAERLDFSHVARFTKVRWGEGTGTAGRSFGCRVVFAVAKVICTT